jgi:hypothetical protein
MGTIRKCVIRMKLVCNENCLYYEKRRKCRKEMKFLEEALDGEEAVNKYMKTRSSEELTKKGEANGRDRSNDDEGSV